MLTSVLLPLPDFPITATNSPVPTSRLTLLSAGRLPAGVSYRLTTSSRRISGRPSTRPRIDGPGRGSYRRPGVVSLPPYPTGWYAFGLASELAPGAVLSRPFMGEDLVVYRTRSGHRACGRARTARTSVLISAMAAGWTASSSSVRFTRSPTTWTGACVRTGYGTKPPARARLAQRPVREVNGLLLVWHGAGAPSWEVPALDLDGWTPVRCRRFVLRDHPAGDDGEQRRSRALRDRPRLSQRADAARCSRRRPVSEHGVLRRAAVAVALPWRTDRLRVRDAHLRARILARRRSRATARLEARLWVLPTPIDEQTTDPAARCERARPCRAARRPHRPRPHATRPVGIRPGREGGLPDLGAQAVPRAAGARARRRADRPLPALGAAVLRGRRCR